MSEIKNRFYKNRVALNVLASSIENAKEVFEVADGHVIVGVLSKDYNTVEEAVTSMKGYGKEIENAISIGLGDGDNRQASVVAEIAKHYQGCHINQVFPSVNATRANSGQEKAWINALVSPTGKPGYVNISTGPISAATDVQAIVPIESAIALVKDMGGNAIKYFPMKGLAKKEEYEAVAKACGEYDFPLEPTGGINVENFEEIVQIALDHHVPYIIPHVYSSVIDKQTGKTKVEDVEKLYHLMKKIVV